MKVTADQIKRLLEEKHSADVIVTECKMGPTQTQRGASPRLDAWVMKRSWANARVIGYEIKVTRRDFVGDDKWQQYLEACNEFYFVCPPGIIKPEEVPDGCGLLHVAKTGTRLFTKRKAAFRDVQVPESLYRYILMSRADIHAPKPMAISPQELGRANIRRYWERWLEQREVDFQFGRMVSGAIRETVQRRVFEVERENDQLRKENAGYAELREQLEAAGYEDVPSAVRIGARRIARELTEMENHLPRRLGIELRGVARAAESAADSLDALEEKRRKAEERAA